MNAFGALLPLLPVLAARGEIIQTVEDVHTLVDALGPLMATKPSFADAVATLSKNQTLDAVIAAAYRLAKTGAVLLSDKDVGPTVVALLQSLAS